MTKSENIICISFTTWEGPYTKSIVQLMSLMAKNNKILFVEYPFTVKDILTTLLRKNNAPIARMLGLRKRLILKKTAAESYVYNYVMPPSLPMNLIRNKHLYSILLKINMFIFRSFLKRVLLKLDMKSPICINAYNPVYGEQMVGKVNEKANIYYCYDGYYTDRRGMHSWRADQSFSKMVNGIIVTSDFLRSQKVLLNPNVVTIKNGVDFDLFRSSAKNNIHFNRQKKIIGYIGSIDQRFDIDTMMFVIHNLHEYDFEFVGDSRNNLIPLQLKRYANVRFSSPVAPSEVPSLLKNYDVGIIPYIANEMNRNVYPLKINEYLAVGLPVISTRFADIIEFEEIVSFVRTKEEFLNAVRFEAENDSAEKIKQRINMARNNSWKARADSFEQTMALFCNK